MVQITIGAALVFVFSAAASQAAGAPPLYPSLEGRVLCGYQGWFRTPDDQAKAGWRHYLRQRDGAWLPVNDYLPDVSEAKAEERCRMPLACADGGVAEPPKADAAEPPMPEPNGIPLSISISKPNGSASAARIAISAAPAVLRGASNGSAMAFPRMAAIRTTGSSIRRTLTRSPGPARA